MLVSTILHDACSVFIRLMFITLYGPSGILPITLMKYSHEPSINLITVYDRAADNDGD